MLNILIQHIDEASGSLWQYCKEIPAVGAAGDIINFDGTMKLINSNLKQK